MWVVKATTEQAWAGCDASICFRDCSPLFFMFIILLFPLYNTHFYFLFHFPFWLYDYFMDTKGQERLSDGTIALKDESHQWRSRRPPTSSNTLRVRKTPGDSNSYDYERVRFRIVSTVSPWFTFINLHFSIKFPNEWTFVEL